MLKKVDSLQSAIYTQPAFYSQSAVCILSLVCILPLVRSLQSAVRSLPFTLTVSQKVIQISCRTSSFVVGMIYSLFYRHNSFEFLLFIILGQQLLFKRKHRCTLVVPIQANSLGLLDGKKVKDCDYQYVFASSTTFQSEEGMDLGKEMSSKCSFTCICRIVLPLNPSATTVYARSAFYPNLRFTLRPQSAFYTDRIFYCIKTEADRDQC